MSGSLLWQCHFSKMRLCGCRQQEGFNLDTAEVKEAVKLLDKNGDG